MAEPFTHAWLQARAEHVNVDAEMRLIGNWLSIPISLSFDDTRFVLKLDAGRISEVIAQPRIDERSVFGFRAPLEVWRKYFEPVPPPRYHDIFAMLMRVPEFKLDGDSQAFMQNARAVHRMMSVLRGAH